MRCWMLAQTIYKMLQPLTVERINLLLFHKYCSKPCATPQTFLTHTTMSLCALCRFYRRGDRSFRKAEKQRLKAEKRQLKAEVKEIRKQLRMERRGIQWSAAGDGSSSPVLLQPRATQVNSPE